MRNYVKRGTFALAGSVEVQEDILLIKNDI
jgi:hypothetical protein